MAVMMMLVVLMKMNISGHVATRQDDHDHDCDEQLKKGDLSCAMRRNINRKPKLKVHCPHDQHDHAYKAHVAM